MQRMSDERLAEIQAYFHDGNLEAQYEIEPREWRDAVVAERTAYDALLIAARTHIHGDIVNPATCRLCAIIHNRKEAS